MAEIKIPKKNWDIFSITYSTPVKCPRCGQIQYIHTSEYGETYKKYYPERMYDNFITDHCDYCGEELIIEMEREKVTELELDTWYDVKPKFSDNYADAMKVYIYHLGQSDCGNVIVYRADGWNETIEHCRPLDICKEVIFNNFEILGISENQDIEIKACPEPLRLSDIQAEKVYKVQVRDERSVHADYHYAEIVPYNPVLRGDDNFTETWYHVVIYKEERREVGCIIKCGALESCIKYLYDNFFVFENIN